MSLRERDLSQCFGSSTVCSVCMCVFKCMWKLVQVRVLGTLKGTLM